MTLTRLRTTAGAAFLYVYAGGLAAAAVAVLWTGRGYYVLDALGRSQHPLHAQLRSGGPLGIGLGVLGTALMLAMLSYSVRKRIPGADWLGSPGWWLRFHIVCGVMGPVFILLHSAFIRPYGLVAVGFWCMVLVALSGGFGRFVFGHLPRTAEGRRLGLRAAQEASTRLRAELVAQTASARADHLGEAVVLARDLDWEVRSPLGLLGLDVEVRRRARQIRALVGAAGLPPEVTRQARRTLIDQLKMKRSLEAWEVTRRLFAWWHLFHEPLAKAMYLIVGIHVALAVWFGGALQVLAELWS